MNIRKLSYTAMQNFAPKLIPALCLLALSGCSAATEESPAVSTSEAITAANNFAPMALSTKLTGQSGSLIVLGVAGGSQANAATINTWSDSNSADEFWRLVDVGNGNFNILDQNSQQGIAVSGVNPAPGTAIVQWPNLDQSWHFVDKNDGYAELVNNSTGQTFGIPNMTTTLNTPIVEWGWNASPDQEWRPLPKGNVRIRNVNSGLILAVSGGVQTPGTSVVQYTDSGILDTLDRSWQFVPNAGNDGYFLIRNANIPTSPTPPNVLGVAGHSTANPASIVQAADDGSTDHLWRLRYETTTGRFRIQNKLTGLVLAVSGASKAPSAQIMETGDTGTLDHVWEFLPDPTQDSTAALTGFQTTNVHVCGSGHGTAGHFLQVSVFNFPTNNGGFQNIPNAGSATVASTGTFSWYNNDYLQVLCTTSQLSKNVTVVATDTTTQLATTDVIPAEYFCTNGFVGQNYQGGCP